MTEEFDLVRGPTLSFFHLRLIARRLMHGQSNPVLNQNYSSELERRLVKSGSHIYGFPAESPGGMMVLYDRVTKRQMKEKNLDYAALVEKAAGPLERTHCQNGHSLVEFGYVQSSGRLVCRLCGIESSKRYRARIRLVDMLARDQFSMEELVSLEDEAGERAEEVMHRYMGMSLVEASAFLDRHIANDRDTPADVQIDVARKRKKLARARHKKWRSRRLHLTKPRKHLLQWVADGCKGPPPTDHHSSWQKLYLHGLIAETQAWWTLVEGGVNLYDTTGAPKAMEKYVPTSRGRAVLEHIEKNTYTKEGAEDEE